MHCVAPVHLVLSRAERYLLELRSLSSHSVACRHIAAHSAPPPDAQTGAGACYRWMGSSPAAVLKVMHLEGLPIPSIRAAAAAKLACTHMFISLSGVNHLPKQAEGSSAKQPAHRSPKELACSKCASPFSPPLHLTTATSGKFNSYTPRPVRAVQRATHTPAQSAAVGYLKLLQRRKGAAERRPECPWWAQN